MDEAEQRRRRPASAVRSRFGTNAQSGAFAWQAIVGASFPVPNVPGLSLTADYRFMDILGGEKFGGWRPAAPSCRPAETAQPVQP